MHSYYIVLDEYDEEDLDDYGLWLEISPGNTVMSLVRDANSLYINLCWSVRSSDAGDLPYLPVTRDHGEIVIADLDHERQQV